MKQINGKTTQTNSIVHPVLFDTRGITLTRLTAVLQTGWNTETLPLGG